MELDLKIESGIDDEDDIAVRILDLGLIVMAFDSIPELETEEPEDAADDLIVKRVLDL